MQEKIRKLQELAAYLKDDTYSEQLIRIGRSLEDKTFLLTVMGQFSAGKSRLLNNLMDRQALPVHSTETTALVTLLRYGEQECVELLLRDGTLKILPLEESLELWQSGGKELSEIEQITIYVNSPLLQNGLVLADTPGVNTIIRTHEQLTEEIITRSDRVLYVMSKSMTETDRAFIKGILSRGIQVIFVRTHMDELRETEEDMKRTVEAERAELKELTEDEIFFLSNDQKHQAYEGLEKLRDYLTVTLSARLEEAIAENAAQRLDFIAGQLGQELFERRMNLSRLLGDSSTAYQEAREETEAELAKMEAILEKNRNGLRKKYLDVRQEALDELEETTKGESKKAARKIDDLNLGTASETYLPPVEAIIKSGCFAIQQGYLSHFDQMLTGNRAELEAELSDFASFASLSGQIPENLEASSEQTREAAERMCALKTLQEQITGRLDELAQEQTAGQRDTQKLAMEMEELTAAKEAVQRQLNEYPPYVAKYITEEGSHRNENAWRAIGKLADVATILIPSEAWLKMGEMAVKGLKGTGTAVKMAKYIDAAVDGARILNSMGPKARQRVAAADPSLLDYLSIEYYFAKIGKSMDPPAVIREDQEYLQRYKQERAKIERGVEEKSAEEAKKQAKLLDIRDQQEKRNLERQILEKKQKAAEEQLTALKREMESDAKQARIRAIRSAYSSLAGDRLNDFCRYVREELAAQTDQAVEGYLGTYDFRISAQIRKKRSELEELETRFRNGERGELEQELALCTKFAAFLDGSQETAEV